jgi:hypothetical protein
MLACRQLQSTVTSTADPLCRIERISIPITAPHEPVAIPFEKLVVPLPGTDADDGTQVVIVRPGPEARRQGSSQ